MKAQCYQIGNPVTKCLVKLLFLLTFFWLLYFLFTFLVQCSLHRLLVQEAAPKFRYQSGWSHVVLKHSQPLALIFLYSESFVHVYTVLL